MHVTSVILHFSRTGLHYKRIVLTVRKKISGGIYLIKKNKISHIVRKEACLVHQHGSLNRPTNQKFAIARFLSDAVGYTSLGNKHPHTQSEQKKVLKAKQ